MELFETSIYHKKLLIKRSRCESHSIREPCRSLNVEFMEPISFKHLPALRLQETNLIRVRVKVRLRLRPPIDESDGPSHM